VPSPLEKLLAQKSEEFSRLGQKMTSYEAQAYFNLVVLPLGYQQAALLGLQLVFDDDEFLLMVTTELGCVNKGCMGGYCNVCPDFLDYIMAMHGEEV
jgi:hypothetical protein